MKKILSLMAGCLLIVGISQAQTATNIKALTPQNSATSGLDTVTNTAVKAQITQLDGYSAITTIQATITKISGTLAGSLVLSGSLDGTAYTAIGSAYTVTDTAAQYPSFSVNPSTYRYYKLSWTGTGTMAGSIKSKLLYRNLPK